MARHLGIEAVVHGRPMSFWRESMPRGMCLRSPRGWHFDPLGVHTFDAFARERSLPALDPIPLEQFVEYGEWFCERTQAAVDRRLVTRLSGRPSGFRVELNDGSTTHARIVVLCPGFRPFRHVPHELAERLPPGCWKHSCDVVNPAEHAGQRVLIVGGRQSAFELAALLHEAGASEIHLAYRHDTPEFVTSDWDFIAGMMERTEAERGWFRRLPAEEQEAIRSRFWSEGRLKLEPWLSARTAAPSIVRHPRATITSAEPVSDAMRLSLSDGTVVTAERVVLATGFRVDLSAVAYIDRATLPFETVDGSPRLDDAFQTTVHGLFMTGLAAARDFGPFFGFVRACASSARIMGPAIAACLASSSTAR
jgi:hypothetical protein